MMSSNNQVRLGSSPVPQPTAAVANPEQSAIAEVPHSTAATHERTQKTAPVSGFPTPQGIERWVPSHLGQVVGCDDLKDHFRDQLRLDACGVNTFVSGSPGTGKTATVKAFVRSLMCPRLDPSTLLPCTACRTCRTFDVRNPDEGIHALSQERAIAEGGVPIHFFPVNCGAVSEAQLREILDDRRDYVGRFLIYLDEAHRLVRRKMEHLLLKPLEELDALWIASSACPEELDKMFLRRFSAKIRTTPPTQAELADFLGVRCGEWGITVDSPETLILLARRSRLITANAKSVLAIAAGKGRRLTRDLVLEHHFDFDGD